MKTLVTIALLAFAQLCFAAEANRNAVLTETVRMANESLQSHDYGNVVRFLFRLSDQTEIASATAQIQRPRSLAVYEQLFAQLINVRPIYDSDPPNTATFKCPTPIIVGKDSWDRYDSLSVMFIFDGSHWIFHDTFIER